MAACDVAGQVVSPVGGVVCVCGSAASQPICLHFWVHFCLLPLVWLREKVRLCVVEEICIYVFLYLSF